jgi:dienelactone hydrolase
MKGARRIAIGIVAAALVAAALVPYWTAAALVLRAAGMTGWPGAAARWSVPPVSDSIVRIPVRFGAVDAMRGRVFRPAGAAARSVLLVSGVHRDGIDEPRLVMLARELAATGANVITPEIEDLVNFRLTPRVTDSIEDAAVWMLSRPDMFGTRPIGLIGVSFSGGLSIVAAGRATLRGRVAHVLSFGGHGNLPRVLNYLCTGMEPLIDGRAPAARRPHDYAVAVLLHQAAELAVPSGQVDLLRHAIETFLQASSVNRTSVEDAAQLFADARARQAALPEPSRTFMKHVNDRDVAALGRALLPYVNRLGQESSLSPDRSPPPSAPVYLLHGADDNVIPAVESALLADHLREHTRVRQLLTRYLTHVDLTARPTAKDMWDMIAFWKALLDEY